MIRLENVKNSKILKDDVVGLTYTIKNPITLFYSQDTLKLNDLFYIITTNSETFNGNIFFDDVCLNNLTYRDKSDLISKSLGTFGNEKIDNKSNFKNSLKEYYIIASGENESFDSNFIEAINYFKASNIVDKKIVDLSAKEMLIYFFCKCLLRKPKHVILLNLDKYIITPENNRFFLKTIKQINVDFGIQFIIFSNKDIMLHDFKDNIVNIDTYKTPSKEKSFTTIDTKPYIRTEQSFMTNLKKGFYVTKTIFSGHFINLLLTSIFALFAFIILTSAQVIVNSNKVEVSSSISIVFIIISAFYVVSFSVYWIYYITILVNKNINTSISLVANGCSKSIIYSRIPIVIFGFLVIIIGFTTGSTILILRFLLNEKLTEIKNYYLIIQMLVLGFIIPIIYSLIYPLKFLSINRKINILLK